MKSLIFKLLSIILYILLHARTSWIIPTIIVLIIGDVKNFSSEAVGGLIGFILMCAIIISFIYVNCGLLDIIINKLVKLFNIQYEYEGKKIEDMTHSQAVWTHPIYKIKLDNGKNIYAKPSFARIGGTYEPETLKKRIILFTYLFNNYNE